MYQNFSKEELKQLVRALNESGELEQLLHEASASTSADTAQGSMNDSSKRRLTSSVVSAKEELDQFEVGYSSHAGTEIRLPEGLQSLKQWGSTICELPKVAKREMTYDMMITEADSCKEMRDYLTWVTNSGVKSSKMDDIRAYLKAVQYSPGISKFGVTYPGSKEARRFGHEGH
ncbi:unnamed protein product [Durusdinium trenchii]|uniref:Uncharacterized protein n=1 Tax=Durusdinium trenchii TaxID=1381693 RepID=A0ABP0I3P7_9DINO